MNDFDILVIGAGAAGLAAGMRLARSAASFRILEARGRSGGRAFTQAFGPSPIDRGCGWLHSADRNAWRDLAEAAGFSIDKNLPAWGEQAFDLGFSRDEQAAFAAASERFNDKLFATGPSEPDHAAADLFEPGNRWNPLIDAVSTYMSGAELEHISVQDLTRYADSEINWRIREGYGAAITSIAGADLPVEHDCVVTEIDHSGLRLRLDTSKGRFTARAIIITLPTSLLAADALHFLPELPEKREAAAGLPLGIANKLFIALDQPEDLPIDGHLFGRIDRTKTASYHLRPFGRQLIECYFGGALAHDLEKAGAQAFFAFACDELALLFGSAVRARLHFITATSWAEDRFSRGSYSYARPGHADARQKLAECVDQRLFFAGEACSRHSFSTAHGAYETGVEAAEQALAAINMAAINMKVASKAS